MADERTRIARELNAVVARSISQMVVQSDAARRLLVIDRARADAAMEGLEEAGRDTLVEMRRILGVLRRIDDAHALAPQPGLGQIPGLIEHACETGRLVALRVEGEPGPLPASVDISMYRIVHEALATAADGAVEIVLRFGEDDLALTWSRTGPWQPGRRRRCVSARLSVTGRSRSGPARVRRHGCGCECRAPSTGCWCEHPRRHRR